MNTNLPTPPKPSFFTSSGLLIWLLPILLPLIRKFAARLIARVSAFILVFVGGFLTKNGFTGDEFSQYGIDLDMEKVLAGLAAVVVAVFVFGIETVVSWLSTKLVPPPKAISVDESAIEYKPDSLTGESMAVSGTRLTVEPKLRLPQSTEKSP